jgi:hypothetical protein
LYDFAYYYTGSLGIILRDFRIYAGRDIGCFADIPAFGEAPGLSFRVQDYVVSEENEVEGRLIVPSEWGSSSQLSSGYRLQWFLVGEADLTPISEETRELSLDSLAPPTVREGVYAIEARVRHLATDSVVSVRGPELFVVGCLEFDDAVSQIRQECAISWPTNSILGYIPLVNRVCL